MSYGYLCFLASRLCPFIRGPSPCRPCLFFHGLSNFSASFRDNGHAIASVDFLSASPYRQQEIAELKLSGRINDVALNFDTAFRIDSDPDPLDSAKCGDNYRFGRWFLREASVSWNKDYTHYISCGKILFDSGSFSSFFSPLNFFSDYSGYTNCYVDAQALSVSDALPSGVFMANYRLVLDVSVFSLTFIPKRIWNSKNALEWNSVFRMILIKT